MGNSIWDSAWNEALQPLTRGSKGILLSLALRIWEIPAIARLPSGRMQGILQGRCLRTRVSRHPDNMPLVSNNKLVASISQVQLLVSSGPIDICKTPTPSGPVPIPYPNIATTATPGPGYSTKTLVMGTPAFTKKSKIALSNGDQPGIALGLISNRIMGMAAATMASPDVSIEGGAVVRTGDKGQSNMGSPGNSNDDTFVSLVLYVPGDDTLNLLCNVFCEARKTGHDAKSQDPSKRFNYSKEAENLSKGKYAAWFKKNNLVPERSVLVSVPESLITQAGRKSYTPQAILDRMLRRARLAGAGFSGTINPITNGAAELVFSGGVLSTPRDAALGALKQPEGLGVARVKPDVGLYQNGKLTKVYDYKFDYPEGGSDSFQNNQDKIFNAATGDEPEAVDAENCNNCQEAST